jgi:hypothetical protein
MPSAVRCSRLPREDDRQRRISRLAHADCIQRPTTARQRRGYLARMGIAIPLADVTKRYRGGTS